MKTQTVLILSGVGVGASMFASCATLKTLSENAVVISENVNETSSNLRKTIPDIRKSLEYALILSGVALAGIAFVLFRRK